MKNTAKTKNQKGKVTALKYGTKVGVIAEQYGVSLGVRSDMKLGNYLKKKGYPSLSKMLE